MRRLAFLLVVGLLTGTQASAAPVAPTQLGSGDDPWLFVDRQGTTHATWEAPIGGNNSQLHYRRLPAGAAAFGPDRVLPVIDGKHFSNAFIVQDPLPSNRLVIVVERASSVTGTPGTYALTSLDSGVAWSAPVAVYTGAPSVNPTDGPVSLVANGVSGLYLINGNPFMRAAIVPPALAPIVDAVTKITDKPNNGSVAFDAAGQPVFAFSDLTQPFVRAGIAGPDLLAAQYPDVLQTIKIAGGPRGIAVLTSGGRSLLEQIDVRLLTGGALSAPVKLTAVADNFPRVPFVATDSTGRFHVAWRSDARNGDILYRRSDNGVSWTPTATVASGGSGRRFGLVIGAGPDGGGWAVWTDGLGGTNRILAAPLTTVVNDPSVPDTTGIVNPQVIRNGSGLLVAPKRISLAALRTRKCVNVRVQTTRPARVGVAIFSGTRSIRVFGRATVRFTAPGKRLICIKVPLRANTFDIRKAYRFAFAIQSGARPKKGERPPREVNKVFRFLP